MLDITIIHCKIWFQNLLIIPAILCIVVILESIFQSVIIIIIMKRLKKARFHTIFF